MHAVREVAPGAYHFPRFLSINRQKTLVDRCRQLIDGEAPAYVPTVRGGGKMRVRMLCLGRHWNARTYQYQHSREHDGLPAPPLPPDFRALAVEIAGAAGMAIAPDVCLINYYGSGGRMGLHQDKDEGPESLAAGIPVVSVSLGDTARFLFGGVRRRDVVEPIRLDSGDAFVFGGPARLCYHGVSGITPFTAPLELDFQGRFNLTFRQSDDSCRGSSS